MSFRSFISRSNCLVSNTKTTSKRKKTHSWKGIDWRALRTPNNQQYQWVIHFAIPLLFHFFLSRHSRFTSLVAIVAIPSKRSLLFHWRRTERTLKRLEPDTMPKWIQCDYFATITPMRLLFPMKSVFFLFRFVAIRFCPFGTHAIRLETIRNNVIIEMAY